MTQFNFEGDFIGISDRQLEFINNIIQEQGFENSKVIFEPVGKAGDNYVANVKRIIIEGENGNLNMIAKIAPTIEIIRQFTISELMFKNEHVMYTEVLPKFTQLQKDAGVPENEQLRYAKCYGSFTEPPNEVILLEDLKTLDFTMLDRFQPLSNECVKSVLKNFAILHSLSLVLKHKEPHVFEHFKANLIDAWVVQSSAEYMQGYYSMIEGESLTILDNPDHINLVRHKIANTANVILKLAKDDMDNKYNVILQGDGWTNNIMFKMENDEVRESIMIDYQASRSSNPVVDVMYMIFNCTDHETRKQHYFDWLDYYHSELAKSLYDFGLKVDFVYPRDKFDADLKRYGKLAFGLSVLLANMLIRKSDDAAKMIAAMETVQLDDNMEEKMEEFGVTKLDEASIDLYKKRLTGLIDSFVEFGLL